MVSKNLRKAERPERMPRTAVMEPVYVEVCAGQKRKLRPAWLFAICDGDALQAEFTSKLPANFRLSSLLILSHLRCPIISLPFSSTTSPV